MNGLPQLRVRTEYSFRSTFAPIGRVAAACAHLEASAGAICDAGTWGHVAWAKECAKVGVKPLFGCELPILQPDGLKPLAWALAEDTRAFYRFSSAARLPGADVEGLFRAGAGLIRFAGAALADPDAFDYIDLNPASPLQQQRALALHKRTRKPLVVTSDNAYALPEDYAAFMAIAHAERATPQHLLSEAELRAALPCLTAAQWRAACANTHEAAERAASKLPAARIINFPGDLRALADAGKRERIALGHIVAWTDEYEARLQRELAMIAQKQYESYFLVVADLIRWAKTRMLVGPGRGSSAGSLVCYCLRITEIDPLPHDLLFERFIDVVRNDLPDIDIDFSDARREQAFVYLAEKYGHDNVARIGSINTLRARSVLARVTERLAIPEREKFDVLNVLIDYSSGDSRYGHALEDTMTQTEPGKRFLAAHPEAAVMFALENHASHTGVHAAGVIVCNEPINEFCTVGADGVAQLDKPCIDPLGLLKIDALGLRTLGVIEDAGVVTADELYALKLDDPKVFALLNAGRYAGVFQFEGQAMRRVAAEVDIKSFREIDHITALARPGPLGGGASQHYIARAAGRESVTYKHPSMAAYLGDTMGVVLYQEQVMRVSFEVGRFSWEVVSEIRKAMSGRKGKEYFDRRGAEFIAGATAQGLSKEDAEEIWHEICTFGAWGMNKCVHKDTQIKLAHPNKFLSSCPTIEALYDYYVARPSAWIRQRKLMPVLLCVGPDGVARPRMAVNIHKTEAKTCVRMEFDDGSFVECTEEHRFIIDGFWKTALQSRVGSEFSCVAKDHSAADNSYGLGLGQGWRKGRVGAGSEDSVGGKDTAKLAFKARRWGTACDDCGDASRGRMEVHHNDLVGGLERPEDLAWLCNSCHKQRHIDNGTRRAPYARGHLPAPPKILIRYAPIGVHETYDIEMPAPDHNFVLANGLVSHNSHTVSYAVISYWCAWMKVYHSLEYAAACLRNAKDEEQATELLRDMRAEGVAYTAFDPARSVVDWAVVDGELLGGFKNLVGYGPAKATKAIDQRRLGKLDLDKLNKAEVRYAELYPLSKAYAALYADPCAHGCREGSAVARLDALPLEGDVLTVGKVLRKELRDENETVRLGKRDGRRLTGQTLFLDIFITDDTGVPITARIDRFKFPGIGKSAAELLQPGDALLIRGKKIPNFAMIKVARIKVLNREVAL